MGTDPDVDAHYRPARRSLTAALADDDVRVEDIALVVNCHLHFDHCGGNPELAGRPIFSQRVELTAAREADYTLPELVDVPGLVYEVLDGEAEILPGVLVVPTPGHTAGHQSLVVRSDDGTVVVAGQVTTPPAPTALMPLRGERPGRATRRHCRSPPARIDRLQSLDPRRVVNPDPGRPRRRKPIPSGQPPVMGRPTGRHDDRAVSCPLGR